MDQPVTVNPYSTGIDASGFDMEQLWPEVDPQFKPFGARLLIQIRRVVTTTKSGLILVSESKDTEAWNMQVGKIISMGPLAFKNRKSAEDWPEGMWAKVGDFVRFPRWGGDRITVKMKDGEPVVILILNDHDLLGAYQGDPREVHTFIE